MNTTYAVVRPDPEAWAAIPRSVSGVRQTVVAWLIVLGTTVGAFIADRGWEDGSPWATSPNAYRVTDMFETSVVIIAFIFALGGWVFGRLAVTAAPTILSYAAVVFTLNEHEAATVWWIGAALATLWWFAQMEFGLRQIRVIRRLAQQSHTGETLEVGTNAERSLWRIKKQGLAWAAGLSALALVSWLGVWLILPGALGRIYAPEDGPFVEVLAAIAGGFSVLAIVQWGRCGRRLLARRLMGNLVWHVPILGGPVERVWSSLSEYVGIVEFSDARASASCTCVEDVREVDGCSQEEMIDDYGVVASDYCPDHGIDVINALSAEQFLSSATKTWLWDARSMLPLTVHGGGGRTVIIGYAGSWFPGFPGRLSGNAAETFRDNMSLVADRDRTANESEPVLALRPNGGVVDVIDLAPAELGGRAVRYRHGRAWLDTLDEGSSTGEPV